jgi:hypothetical protein
MQMRWLVPLLGAMAASAVACAQSAPSGTEDMPHMRMTVRQPPQPGDSARAAMIVAAARASLLPYEDYHKALADGFHIFAPNVKQPVYHFTSRERAILAQFHFDPAKPTSLLYEKTGDSTYRLVGAMYTAPRRASLADLNARIPLSVAQWHLHTNLCLPRLGQRNRLTERGSDGRPLFGVNGSITTEAACTAADGRFIPEIFGWMVHIHPMATDPSAVWGAEHMDDEHMEDMSHEHMADSTMSDMHMSR